ncbi:MAG: hypothetical protein KBA31_00105 [Alphaproteobacteria bacterium]|nr:hypothetical protein [Alphaproteobacteria bacterium]
MATNHDGEVVATVRAIGRILATAGCDFHDLSAHVAGAIVSDVSVMLAECQARIDLFNDKEARFLRDAAALIAAGHELSDKQAAWVMDLHRIAVTRWDRGCAV